MRSFTSTCSHLSRLGFRKQVSRWETQLLHFSWLWKHSSSCKFSSRVFFSSLTWLSLEFTCYKTSLTGHWMKVMKFTVFMVLVCLFCLLKIERNNDGRQANIFVFYIYFCYIRAIKHGRLSDCRELFLGTASSSLKSCSSYEILR